jgi:hypothetical protein
VTAVTLGASDLGRIVNGRDGDPDEKRPFLFSFSKPKVLAAWRKLGAMQLKRACLRHPEVRSVAGGQGPDAGNLEALAASHKKKRSSLAEAGYNSRFAGSVLTHIPVARPSTDEEKIAELIRLGKTNSKNL